MRRKHRRECGFWKSTHHLSFSQPNVRGFENIRSFAISAAFSPIYSSQTRAYMSIGVAKGGPKEPWPPNIFRKFSHFVLWEAFSKQNSVIRLKSNILVPPNFWADYVTVYVCLIVQVVIVAKTRALNHVWRFHLHYDNSIPSVSLRTSSPTVDLIGEKSVTKTVPDVIRERSRLVAGPCLASGRVL